MSTSSNRISGDGGMETTGMSAATRMGMSIVTSSTPDHQSEMLTMSGVVTQGIAMCSEMVRSKGMSR